MLDWTTEQLKAPITINLNKERKSIFFIVLGLSLFGLLFVYEASSIYAYNRGLSPLYFFKKQLIFLVVSLFLFSLTLFLNFELLRRYNREILLFNIILLILVLVVGRRIGGAKRWFNFGWFSFQPSELLKISLLIYFADYCSRKRNLLHSIKYGLLPLGLVLGFICLLLLLEPDLGTTAFWIIWTLLFLYISGARLKHLFIVVVLGILFLYLLIVFFPYRFRRFTAYLNPFVDPQNSGFQIIQSQIAFAQGGLFGVGFGEGKQKLFFLPAAHTDFIFSIIAEELGFLFSAFLVVVFFILFYKMFRIAKLSLDTFNKMILFGIIFIFFLQVIINIGVTCALFPTKGLPLPFISYGGSNLLVHYVLLGLFFNVSKKDENIASLR